MSLLTSEFYRHLINNSTDLLSVIDADGMYKYVGDSVQPILGYSPAELVGKNAFSYIHPDDAKESLNFLQKASQADKMTSPPFRFLSKNNGWRWLECTISNQMHNEVIRGIITNSRDITETIEERAQKDLHQAYYRSLFEEHPEAVFSLDTLGYFKSVNKQFSRILGYSEQEMLRMHFTEFTHPEDILRLRSVYLDATGGASRTIELRVLDARGSLKLVHVTLLPVYLQEKVISVQGIARDITEVSHTQQLIQEHSEQLRKILESVTEPFYALDSDWCYTFANQAYCNFLGKKPQELTGKNIWTLYPPLRQSKLYQKCLEVVRTGKTLYLEESYEFEKELTLSYSIFPFVGGIAIHFVDVTTQNMVKREMEKLSLVASKTINGVVIMNPRGEIEWVNDGFTRLSGYTREEAIGHVPSKLLQGQGSDLETQIRIRQKYQQQVHFTEEVLNYRKTGEPYWVNIDVTPIKDANGALLNYIAIQTDITDKKKAEVEQIKLADDLYKQNLNLQQFTYMVSHNLRAPVANAMGLVGLLRKIEAGTQQYNKVLEKLDLSVSQLDGVIKDINGILTIREAGRTLKREQVNLLTITQEVLSPFQDELVSTNANVRLEIDAAAEMVSNKAYLYSIIQNLVSNAIKYRAPERPLELNIGVEQDARGYVYTVSDNGLGMDMKLVENQLFKLYKRFHPSIHGKGIGLFLVKTHIEAIGGKIIVTSAPGVGTRFKLLMGAKHV